MSGTLQLGGTNLAVHSGSGASAKITLDSGLVFPAGHIIQVVNVELTGNVQVSSTTYVDTGLTASITPASASHKILIHLVHNTVYKTTNDTWVNFKFFRDTTDLFNFAEVLGYNANTMQQNVGAAVLNYLDSPNTTSSVTYKTQINSNGNNVGAGFNRNGTRSYITLMEVVA